MYTIYALVDPRTSEIRYIGQTQNHPSVRLQGHLKKEDGNKPKWAWLNELNALGIEPNVVVLEYADCLENALSYERFWIEKGRKTGWPLLNFRVDGIRQRRVHSRPSSEVKHRPSGIGYLQRWQPVVAAWFAQNPQALTGEPVGISDLARAMCVDNEGNIENYAAYKGRAHKLFHDFRDNVRIPIGKKMVPMGKDISYGG